MNHQAPGARARCGAPDVKEDPLTPWKNAIFRAFTEPGLLVCPAASAAGIAFLSSEINDLTRNHPGGRARYEEAHRHQQPARWQKAIAAKLCVPRVKAKQTATSAASRTTSLRLILENVSREDMFVLAVEPLSGQRPSDESS